MEREELLSRLEVTPWRVAEAARAAGSPPPGEWSEHEIVLHLVAVEEEVWHARLDQLASGDGTPEPAWGWVEPGPWAGSAGRTLDGALAELATRRAATLDRLVALDDHGWRRAGIHRTYGRLDVDGLMELALDHDAEHLASLEALAAR